MVLLFFFAIPFVHSYRTSECLVVNQECSKDELLDTFTKTLSMEECRALCGDNEHCTAFTLYGPASFPFSNICMLFSTCLKHNECVACITGSSQSECTCSINFSGTVDANNLVGIHRSVFSEQACKESCANETLCSVYTSTTSMTLIALKCASFSPVMVSRCPCCPVQTVPLVLSPVIQAKNARQLS